jgi:DDE superfamily endonuclease
LRYNHSEILWCDDCATAPLNCRYDQYNNCYRWDSLAASKILFGLLITLLPPHWPIIIAVDETLERRRGKKIKAKGAYRDAVASSQSRVVICFGLKWECMTLIVPLPWCKRPWALPFLIILSASKKSDEAAGKRHKTSIDWTIQMVRCVSPWIKRKTWILVGDGAYACMALAKACINSGATLISRLRLDAQLYEAETFFSTDLANSPMQIIEWFVLRWNIEVTFEETRAHLGIETQRQWSDQAIARTTPLLMALLSILVLVAIKMHETKKLVVQETTSWYDKKGDLTLGDIVMIIRRSIWVKMYFSTSKNQEKNTDSLKITEKNANLLIYQLALAA